jgi:hypothetical protein
MRGMYKGDEVKKNTTQDHHLEYWYNDYLLSYGIHEVLNKTTPNVALNRRVFFINKISFRE